MLDHSLFTPKHMQRQQLVVKVMGYHNYEGDAANDYKSALFKIFTCAAGGRAANFRPLCALRVRFPPPPTYQPGFYSGRAFLRRDARQLRFWYLGRSAAVVGRSDAAERKSYR